MTLKIELIDEFYFLDPEMLIPLNNVDISEDLKQNLYFQILCFFSHLKFKRSSVFSCLVKFYGFKKHGSA